MPEQKDRFFTVVVGFMILAFVFLACWKGIMPTYSEGFRSGVVVKFSKKGAFWKSYEGTLNLGAVESRTDGTLTPTTFDFSVLDPEIVSEITAAQEKGKRITVTYNQWLLAPLFIIDTSYVIKAIK